MKKIIFALSGLLIIALSFAVSHSEAHTFVTAGATTLVAAGPGGMSIEAIERFASNQLSSFDGQQFEGYQENYPGQEGYQENYPGGEGYQEYPGGDGYQESFEGYDGSNDHFMDFGGANLTFANAAMSNKIFTITVTNASQAARTCYLAPGLMYMANSGGDGFIKTGAFNDKGGNAGLTGQGSPTPIELFYSYTYKVPTSIIGIKIQSDSAAQIEQAIVIRHQSPFRELGSRNLYPTVVQNENTFREKIATLQTPDLMISDQVQIEVVIPAGATTTFNILCGGGHNSSKALETKRALANRNISRRSRPARPARPAIGAGRV